MAESVQRSKGRPSNYKLDRGGVPAEFGPFAGIVMSTVDPTRAGRLRVYIDAFAAGTDQNMQDEATWTTVSYMPSFYGSTPLQGTANAGEYGKYPGNQNSYGMWFTPPDVGITVMCVFVNGDRSQGYYIGTIPDQGLGRMVPAIGSVPKAQAKIQNQNQQTYFADATRLPVTEINTNSTKLFNNPRFFDGIKPVQSVVAQALLQQGLITDNERGTINSSSQRESPSAVFGVSTPGIPIYQGGMKPNDIRTKLDAGTLKPGDAQVIGRVGGHSLVMDDGDLQGGDALIRLRTSKGHQITMSDTGNFFYIIHSNGQTWLEFGVEGTVDVYATNSVNVRTKGDINLHADRDINMFAGRYLKMKSMEDMQIETDTFMSIQAQEDITLYSKDTIGVKSDGTLTLNSASGSWGAGSALILEAGAIDLNGPAADEVKNPQPLTTTLLDDTEWDTSRGWTVVPEGLESIVTRAPTHEPYPYHNKGVDVEVEFEEGIPSPPPGAEALPEGVEIQADAATETPPAEGV
jgi:hypothetical protein